MTMRGAWLVVVLGGCVATPRPTYTATFTDRAIRIESYARAFRAAEPGLVANLASDTRLLARIAPKPTAAQLASRDTELPLGAGVWVSREPVDPFLFSDRQTVLEREREGFERVALPADAALQAEVLGARAAGEVTGEEALLRQVKLEQDGVPAPARRGGRAARARAHAADRRRGPRSRAEPRLAASPDVGSATRSRVARRLAPHEHRRGALAQHVERGRG